MRSVRVILCGLLASLLIFGIDTTKLTVQVNSIDTGKPIDRASVIVRFRHGRNVNLKKVLTNWETKTNQEGNVSIPAIPQGEVTIQVIASNYQTFGDVYQLDQEKQLVTIKLKRPQSQYSEDAKHP
jgi:hypothetical protein